MIYKNSTLGGAIIDACTDLELGASELEYKLIKVEKSYFFGLFKRPALIEVDNNFYKLHMLKKDIKFLFSHLDLLDISAKIIEKNLVEIELFFKNPALILGKKLKHYYDIDTAISHLANDKFNLFSIVKIQDALEKILASNEEKFILYTKDFNKGLNNLSASEAEIYLRKLKAIFSDIDFCIKDRKTHKAITLKDKNDNHSTCNC